MAAVVTTPEIAKAFANGMEFFSSFGGNPVSAAAAMATLRVVQEEGLMEQAAEVGAYAVAGLRDQPGGDRIDTVVLACTHFPNHVSPSRGCSGN